MNVSVCMIVRNEESIVHHAIESTRGLADEVIILDTGSEDGTVDLCHSLGATVLTGGDRMHKAQARNTAINAATGDWIVILDCDERIADPVGFRHFLETTDAGAVYVRTTYMSGDKSTLSYSQMRAWRKGTYLYKYRAHEVPIPVDGWTKLAHTDFVWEHRPPGDRTWKSQYTLDRLILDVSENPGDARPLYYLGRQYMYRKEWASGIERLQQYIDLAPRGRDTVDAWANLATCYKGLNNHDEELRCLHMACAAQPARRDCWGKLAEWYRAKGQHAIAIGLLKCALEVTPSNTSYRLHGWYGAHPHDLLARSLWKERRYKEGHTHALQAVSLEPDNERLVSNLVYFDDVVHSDIACTRDLQLTDTPDLKVAIFATRDHANVGYKMARALSSQNGVTARSVTQSTNYMRYPLDIYRPTQAEIEQLYDWADVIHITDSWKRPELDKPTFVTYNGKYYRDNHEFLATDDAQHGITQLCTTPGLTQYGAHWVPVPMAHGEVATYHNPLRIVHAPTREDVKGTEHVKPLSTLDRVEVDIVRHVSNAECRARIAQASVAVDQFRLGYGVFALEAWANGLPVLSGATDGIGPLIEQHVGYTPFVSVTPTTLTDAVCDMRDDPQAWSTWGEKGYDYLLDFHAPDRVARELLAFYDGSVSKMDEFYRQNGPDVHTNYPRHATIANLVQGDTLDFGCGTGDLLLLLQERDDFLMGVDISPVALDMARQRGVTAQLRRSANVPLCQFDTVVLSQVLEHVDDEDALLQAVFKRLPLGGQLILTVPCGDRVSSPDHKREYNQNNLWTLLSPYGTPTFYSWPGGEYRFLIQVIKEIT